MNSNSQLPELRDPPPALPELSDEAYANIVNAGLLPGEEMHRDRRGTETRYDEVAAQAPVAARVPDAFPAFQRPKSMEEIDLRRRQREFMVLSEQLAKKIITPEVFGQKSALLNLSGPQMDEAGLFILNKNGGKRKSRYLKVNKRRRTRSNKRSNKRSRK